MIRAKRAMGLNKPAKIGPNILHYNGDEILAHHSVTQDDFDRRIRDLGWSVLKSANTPYHPHGRRGSGVFNQADAAFLGRVVDA